MGRRNKRELRLYYKLNGEWAITDGRDRVIRIFSNEDAALQALRDMQINGWKEPPANAPVIKPTKIVK